MEPDKVLTVTFSETGRSEIWDPAYDNLLEFAEAKGLTPMFSCRAGVCASCRCRLLSGEVAYTEEPLDEPEQGVVLICSAVPLTSVSLGI